MIPYYLRYKAQANILKSNGRQFMDLIILQFNAGRANEIKATLHDLCNCTILPFKVINSNQEQLYESQLHNNEPTNVAPQHSVVITLHLSYKGLVSIGKTSWVDEVHKIFRKGMKHMDSRQNLKDPPKEDWEPNYQEEIHALFVVASNSKSSIDIFVEKIRTSLEAKNLGKILFTESGSQMRRGNYAIEPFGFRDNISNPIFYTKKTQKKWDR